MRRHLLRDAAPWFAVFSVLCCDKSVDVTEAGGSGAGAHAASGSTGSGGAGTASSASGTVSGTRASGTGTSTTGSGGQGDTCKPYGESCATTIDCCTGTCSAGLCTATCSVSGFCAPSMPCCVGICPNVPEAHCICGPGGSSCSVHADCCTGKCLAGACTTSCTRGGQFCSGDGECCSHTCTPNGCTCAHNGAACIYDYECCLGICKAGQCACGSKGAQCESPGDPPCCGFTCGLVGQNEYQCSCQPAAAFCSFDESCCSGHCVNGACG